MESEALRDELKSQMVAALRRLRLVQRKVTTDFSFVRNATIGHRDPNALAQYRAIRDLNINEVMEIAVEFFAAVEQFIVALTQIMLAGNSLQSYLRQWIESENDNTASEH